MVYKRRLRLRPNKLEPKWYPERNVPNRPKQLAGRTALDIVDAAYAIKADEFTKKQRRHEETSEKRHKAKIAKVSLAKMPWDKGA